jgi:hypothetical protein
MLTKQREALEAEVLALEEEINAMVSQKDRPPRWMLNGFVKER